MTHTWADLKDDWRIHDTLQASDFNAVTARINEHSDAIIASETDIAALEAAIAAQGNIMSYRGSWNASTNSPSLSNGSGDAGDVYIVGTAGSRNFGAGSITFAVGDYVIYSGTVWQKLPFNDLVVSVAGLTGAISASSLKTALSLTSADVGLGNVSNTSDATKWAASAALTNKDLTSGTNTFPTLNQNTTGSAATLTTARTVRTNLASTSTASFNGSADITPGVTGTLPVGNGGSGATTLTGLLVGNGTSAFTAVTAPSGAVVGTTDTQTLTNKTLTTPTVNSFKDSNGNTVLGFSATASAVNYVQVQNSTGTAVRLNAVGGDTNVGMRFYSKANAGFAFFSDTYGRALDVTPASGGVNNIQIIAGATTVAPQVVATGTDSNIDLVLNGTGTGVVKAGGTGASATVVTRDNTLTLANKTLTSPKINQILDTNGSTALYVDGQTSAVNFFYLVNGSAGGSVSLRAAGSDTNISAYLFSKGAGYCGLRSTNGFIIAGGAPASAVNYIEVTASVAGTQPTIAAVGTDTNIGLNLVSKGSSPVSANNVEVATISGSQTLTNKTLGAASISDAANISLGTTTGTKIGTAANQKIGFWNAAPVVQPTAIADATNGTDVITQLNALLGQLRTIGLIAA